MFLFELVILVIILYTKLEFCLYTRMLSHYNLDLESVPLWISSRCIHQRIQDNPYGICTLRTKTFFNAIFRFLSKQNQNLDMHS